MIKETTIPVSQEAQVEFDALHEPFEVCKWDKRRKCDSFYIEMYNKQQKKIKKVLKYIEECTEMNWENHAKEDIKKMLGD